MWPFRKKHKHVPSPPEEYATHVCTYEFHQDDASKMVVQIYLPLRRVSETFYDMNGKIQRHIQVSPLAERHISNICVLNTELVDTIRAAESMLEDRHKQKIKRAKKRTQILKDISRIGWIIWAGWVIWIAIRIFS